MAFSDDARARADAGLQFPRLERFDDVVVRSGIEARHQRVLAFVRGHQDDVHVSIGLERAHRAAHLDAVYFRHGPVQENQAGMIGPRHFHQRRFAVLDAGDVVAPA
jgi:hypothetical protein